MRKPSMTQAIWIHSRLAEQFEETADDVFDVLVGNITSPADFVSEVEYLAREYEDDLRRHNVGL